MISSGLGRAPGRYRDAGRIHAINTHGKFGRARASQTISARSQCAAAPRPRTLRPAATSFAARRNFVKGRCFDDSRRIASEPGAAGETISYPSTRTRPEVGRTNPALSESFGFSPHRSGREKPKMSPRLNLHRQPVHNHASPILLSQFLSL